MADQQSFRKAVNGYDPDEVDAALAERDARIAGLECEASKLSRMMVEQEQRLRAAIAGGGEPPPSGTLNRLRSRALTDAARFADRVVELAKLQEELGFRFTEIASRTAADAEEADPLGTPAEPDPLGPQGEPGWRGFAGLGGTRGPSAPPPDDLYTGTVGIEIGPLGDFAQLTAVEDAIGSIKEVSEVQIAGFSGGRAQLQVTMSAPADLMSELRIHLPQPLKLTAQGADWIVFEVRPRGFDEDDRAA